MRILGLLLFAAAGLFGDSNSTLYVSQFVFGGEWKTTITVVNLSDLAQGQAMVHFWNEDGTPMAVPVGSTRVTELPVTVAPRGVVTIETADAGGAVTVGWVDVDVSTSNISGMSVNTIYRQRVAGRPDVEVFVPAKRPATTSQVFLFDNRGGHATGFAMLNSHRVNAQVVNIIIRNDAGVVLRQVTVTIPPGAHQQFDLAKTYPEADNQLGTVEFALQPSGWFEVVGLRFGGQAITNIEAMIP